MSAHDIRALTFDTGGTILDWHTGFRNAFEQAGKRHQIDHDWASLANELRRRSMKAMLNLGNDEPPAYNFDQAHRFCLDELLTETGLDMFDEQDRKAIAWNAPHHFECWPDFPSVLPLLRSRFIVASFSILSYRLIIDMSKHNGLSWDAVFSCEGLGVYKVLPKAYEMAAAFLQLKPEQCCMVACHPFDLDAARNVGFKTALVHRPLEWGQEPGSQPDNNDNEVYTFVIDDFFELANKLGVALKE